MISEIFSVESFVRICLWQSMVLVVVGLAASFLLRRRSSRAHQVLLLSIVAAVIVPVVSTLVKHYELGMFVAEPVVMQSQLEDQAITSDFSPLGPIAQDFGYEPGPIEAGAPPVITGSQSAPLPWARVALYGWLAASLILAARLIVTFALGVRLLGRSQPLGCEKIEEGVRSARARLGIGKNVEVRSSRGVRSPVIWCWRRRPVLLVPSGAVHCDNSVDWTGVLCHELAHWKRRDHISGLLAEMAVCILPWHLLLWWAKSRLTSLSEQACDDWVLATGQPGTDYAESLLDLTPGGQMAFVPAVVSSKRGLTGRIHRILKDSCGNPRTGAAWALAASAITICVALGVAFAQTRPAKPDVESAVIEPNESADPNEPTVSVNFKNAEFKTVCMKLADWTGKTIIPLDQVLKQEVTIYAPKKLPKNEAAAVILNALRAKDYIVEERANMIIIRRTPRPLPAGWSLDYDDGRLPGGGRRWPANMAENLLELKAIPTPANEYDESWKEER
ncbi:MAG TPA: M56 family metallopeptidase, partial [Sedimentisphaerales bacterium]|nr:M56 family metallopeptidase [Sedimentisphaerales bacterium]